MNVLEVLELISTHYSFLSPKLQYVIIYPMCKFHQFHCGSPEYKVLVIAPTLVLTAASLAIILHIFYFDVCDIQSGLLCIIEI